jgi:predicted DNA-binding protein
MQEAVSAGERPYGLELPRRLAERFENIAEKDGHASVAAAMKFALQRYADEWEERQLMLQAEREVDEESEK